MKERYKLTYFEKEINSCVRKIKEMTFKTLKEAESYFDLLGENEESPILLRNLINGKTIKEK